MEINQSGSEVKTVVVPTLHKDINILLAQLIGWRKIALKKDRVWVGEKNKLARVFDFEDESVIYPIAQHYNIKAKLINNEWVVRFKPFNQKEAVVMAKDKKIALALATVYQYCL